LGEPDVPESAAKQPTLSCSRRLDSERSQATVDNRGVDALAVISATQLVMPGRKRGRSERAYLCAPPFQELWVGCCDLEHDPARLATRGRNRSVGVGHQLGNDLDKIDAALGEVLTKIPATRDSEPNRRAIHIR
jgi:hypothetical protein